MMSVFQLEKEMRLKHFQCSSLTSCTKRAMELGKHPHLKMGHLKGTHETFCASEVKLILTKYSEQFLFMTERNL